MNKGPSNRKSYNFPIPPPRPNLAVAGIASRGPQVIKEEFNGIAWVVVKEDTSRDWLVDQGFSFKVQSLKNENEKYKKK